MDLEQVIDAINNGEILRIDELKCGSVYRVSFNHHGQALHLVRKISAKQTPESVQVNIYNLFREVLGLRTPEIVLLGNDPRIKDGAKEKRFRKLDDYYHHEQLFSYLPRKFYSSRSGLWLSDLSEGISFN